VITQYTRRTPRGDEPAGGLISVDKMAFQRCLRGWDLGPGDRLFGLNLVRKVLVMGGVTRLVSDALKGVSPACRSSPLVKVALRGPLWIIPGAEAVEFAADLLRPPAGGVREKREAWIRLGRLGPRGRIAHGQPFNQVGPPPRRGAPTGGAPLASGCQAGVS
jgi:hypothetical protein